MGARNIRIGFACTPDAGALAGLSRDLIEDGLPWTYRPERILSLICDPEGVVLVARDNAIAAGFAAMRFGDSHAHLVLLAVRASHQRCGIARDILRWLMESAQVAGVMSVHVELRERNRAAYALYRSQGFAETFRVPGYYQKREAAVRMIRLLRTPTAPVAPGNVGA